MGKWSIEITSSLLVPALQVQMKKSDSNGVSQANHYLRYSCIDRRSMKGRVDGVDRNGVEGVRGVTTDIDNNREAP